MGTRLVRALKAYRRHGWFWASFAGVIGNLVRFELDLSLGVMNYFALGLFIVFFAYAVHYSRAKA